MLFMYGTGTFHPSVSYTSKLDKEYVARWEVRERPGQSLTLQGSLKSIKQGLQKKVVKKLNFLY